VPRPASPVARTINRCSSSLPGARQHACVVTMRRRRVPPLTAVPSEMERNRGVNDPGQARAWCPRARLRVVHASVPRLVAEADHCAAEVAENALCGGKFIRLCEPDRRALCRDRASLRQRDFGGSAWRVKGPFASLTAPSCVRRALDPPGALPPFGFCRSNALRIGARNRPVIESECLPPFLAVACTANASYGHQRTGRFPARRARSPRPSASRNGGAGRRDRADCRRSGCRGSIGKRSRELR